VKAGGGGTVAGSTFVGKTPGVGVAPWVAGVDRPDGCDGVGWELSEDQPTMMIPIQTVILEAAAAGVGRN